MLEGFLRSDSLILVIDQALLQQVNSFGLNSAVVGLIDEGGQVTLVRILDKFDQLLWHVDLVSAHVILKFCGSEDINDLHQLVVVV